MRILVDNTGVHSVARCLEGTAKGEIDVLGMLQFATQLVFCDTIVVGTYERNEVIEKTNRVFDKLLSAGIEPSKIERIIINEQDWASGCFETALIFAEDLESLFTTDVGDLLATAPDFADKRVIPDGHIHELISHDRSDTVLSEQAAIALKQGASGMVEYCFTANPTLWNAIRKAWVNKGGWTTKVTAYLAVLLRMYRNDFFAKQYKSYYSPAIARARLLRQIENIVEERLSCIILEAVSKISKRQLSTPSVGMALIRNSKGDPCAVLMEAIELRKKAEPLREVLRQVTQKVKDDNYEATSEFETQMRELSELLEIELGLKKRPELRDALELHFVLGIPTPRLSAKQISDWISYRWKRRQVAVLTDLSKTLAYRAKLNREYKQLVNKAMQMK